MPTINEENLKPLRRALDVVCGIDASTTTTNFSPRINGTIDPSSGLFPSNAKLQEIGIRARLMDLSGEGFENDGLAIPATEEALADSSKYGWLTGFFSDEDGYICNQSGDRSPLVLSALHAPSYWSVNAQDAIPAQKSIILRQGETVTYERWTPNTRVIFDRIVPGIAMQFTNAELVSCNVDLRAVETAVDNPTLQASELEITAYFPNDYSDILSELMEDAPMWYTAGYFGDMSPIRKFYLAEPIELENNLIRLYGQDATKYLDAEYSGSITGALSSWHPLGLVDTVLTERGGLVPFADRVSTMLTNAGIAHDYENNATAAEYSRGEGQLLANMPKRDIISQAVNLLNFEVDFNGEMFPVRFEYVDAGIPKLTINGTKVPYEIPTEVDLKRVTESRIKSVTGNTYSVSVAKSAEIATEEVSGAIIKDLSEPYWSVTAAAGTIKSLGAYRYKLTGSGSIKVSGRAVRLFDNMSSIGSSADYTPYKLPRYTEYDGITVTLDDINGLHSILGDATSGSSPGHNCMEEIAEQLVARSNVTYEFTWRGDPRIQPRDWVVVNGIDMTIETISLDHEEGGLTSTITARRGFI